MTKKHYRISMIKIMLKKLESGIVVQIDESKFTKKNYGKGWGKDEKWMLGGVEVTKERKMFMIVVEEGTEATVLDIITRNVKEGSAIHTDLWKSYNSLKNLDILINK